MKKEEMHTNKRPEICGALGTREDLCQVTFDDLEAVEEIATGGCSGAVVCCIG